MQKTILKINAIPYSVAQNSRSCSSDSSSDEEDEDEKKPILTETSDTTTGAPVPTPDLAKPKPVNKTDRGKCKMCNGPQRCNRSGKPEIFVRCSICQRDGMYTRNVKCPFDFRSCWAHATYLLN